MNTHSSTSQAQTPPLPRDGGAHADIPAGPPHSLRTKACLSCLSVWPLPAGSSLHSKRKVFPFRPGVRGTTSSSTETWVASPLPRLAVLSDAFGPKFEARTGKEGMGRGKTHATGHVSEFCLWTARSHRRPGCQVPGTEEGATAQGERRRAPQGRPQAAVTPQPTPAQPLQPPARVLGVDLLQ